MHWYYVSLNDTWANFQWIYVSAPVASRRRSYVTPDQNMFPLRNLNIESFEVAVLGFARVFNSDRFIQISWPLRIFINIFQLDRSIWFVVKLFQSVLYADFYHFSISWDLVEKSTREPENPQLVRRAFVYLRYLDLRLYMWPHARRCHGSTIVHTVIVQSSYMWLCGNILSLHYYAKQNVVHTNSVPLLT